eukprot:gene731-904_t
MHRLHHYTILIFTVIITVILNINIGKIPPLAKFLDPFQGFWQNSETKRIEFPSQLALAGLEGKVTIYWDDHLIPHIEAQSDRDLYFAQGYITAMHRLWQMEFQARAAGGRLSEIVGKVAVKHDRLQRRKGIVYAANNALKTIEQDAVAQSVVNAYTAGVNAYIQSLSYKKTPIEYKLLSCMPEAWTPFKTLLIVVQLADLMSGYEQSLQHLHAFHLLGEEKFFSLFPDYHLAYETIIPKNTPWGFKMASPHALLPLTKKVELDPKILPSDQAAAFPHKIKTMANNGSNNWAISGKKTVTGYPYLASDPHLNLRLPSFWYGIHLKSPNLNVAGGILPGAPGVLIGFNESIAWGLTNAAWTVRDWYAIDFKDDTKKEYYYDQLLLKSQSVVETIQVKNSAPIIDTVTYTHLGPIVYDDQFSNPNHCKNLAMKWTGHHPGNEILAFYQINRATNLKDFESALQHHHVPIQNFAFASVQNDIALEVAGKLPGRWKNQGKFIMPGNTLASEWQAYIPLSHYPKLVNPKQGYVCSANERATDPTYPYHYHQFYAENYRSRRINQVLSQVAKKVDEKAMMRLQNDNYNLAAYENLSFLMGYLNTTQLDAFQQQAYQVLSDWNFYNEAELLAPSIFHAWQEHLSDLLWASFYDYQLSVQKPTFFQTMHLIKNHATNKHLALERYQGLQGLITESFKQAMHSLQSWQETHKKPYKWRDYAPVNIPHIAYMHRTFGLNNVAVGGGESIVNANVDGHGASMRIIVSLEKNPKAWFSYPGGQSGNPGSPYYTNFVADWSKGKYVNLTLALPESVKNVPGRKMVLMP